MDQIWCFIFVTLIQTFVLLYIHFFCEDKIVIRILSEDKTF